mgnify:CR=1 FL=1|jgi:hypothetical protein
MLVIGITIKQDVLLNTIGHKIVSKKFFNLRRAAV